MSYSQYAGDMDRPPAAGASIRRARERFEAGVSRENFDDFARRMGQNASPQQQQRQRPPPQQQQQQHQQQQQSVTRIPIPVSARRQRATESSTSASFLPSRSTPPRDGQASIAISRPTPAAQWPLPTTGPVDPESSLPPPGSIPPQRPPRPSRTPSILDSSKHQEPITSVFPYNPASQPSNASPTGPTPTGRESDTSMGQQSTTSSASRPSTVSSVGSIPDFPVPTVSPGSAQQQQRRSVNLGPPPSARRGASSFYSNASYVSPIPEESPRSRSHTSIASSAAMPDNWASNSAAMSPNYGETSFYDDVIPEEGSSGYDEGRNSPGADGDESRLVRSASIGKRGKAALITTPIRTPQRAEMATVPSTRAIPVATTAGPSRQGTSYFDGASSSDSTVPLNMATIGSALTADTVLNAYDAASATSPRQLPASFQPRPLNSNNDHNVPETAENPGRPHSRFSAIRRPPRLDIDAVRKAEARGSTTSLPDLIRRATILKASLEHGRRPASRIDDLDMSPGMYGRDIDKEILPGHERQQSGMSDLLAAFPPPAQSGRSIRQSLREQVSSWPVALIGNRQHGDGEHRQRGDGQTDSETADVKDQRRKRRCCGLPIWGFVIVVIILLILIVAAIVIPVEFLVIHKRNQNTSNSALEQCQGQLTCANGGTNVISAQGFCSCICTNGFTGFDCTTAGDNGCTTTSLNSTSSSTLTNVTMGSAVPRLIQEAAQKFSIPLSATQILAMFNAGNLSCVAENALVTFDGEAVRQSNSSSQVSDLTVTATADDDNDTFSDSAVYVVNGVAIVTKTVLARYKREASVFIGSSVSEVTESYSDGLGQLTTATGAPVVTETYGTQQSTSSTSSTRTTPTLTVPSSTTTTTTTVTPSTTAAESSTTASRTTSAGTGVGATATTGSLAPTATFTVTEEVLDFARVAVLYILQEESLTNAEAAQNALQEFFTAASEGARNQSSGATVQDARNLTLSNGNSANLVNFEVWVVSGISASTPT